MTGDRLYLDNAATSFPKPPEVWEAMRSYADEIGASAGRGAYREAIASREVLDDCRERLARLFGVESAEQVVFALNCSAALNLAIKGILRPGDHVVTTAMEHNSVLRPLSALKAQGVIDFTVVPADRRTGMVDPSEFAAAIRARTRLAVVAHGSNVTGTLQDIEQIGRDARRKGAVILVDAAQTAGHVAIDMAALGIDLLAAPGHKGLLGPLGTGVLCIRGGLEREMRPLMEGGTGSMSESPVQPEFMPDKFEPGSHNAIGIAGLAAGLAWIQSRGVSSIQEHERAMCERFVERLSGAPGVRLFGPGSGAGTRVAVFSVRLDGYEPGELSAVLESEFGILTRSGLHCAPLAHETIGTTADGGTCRLSFGAGNTPADVDRAAEALVAMGRRAAREPASAARGRVSC